MNTQMSTPSATSRQTVRLGAVGIDTSHLPEFTRRLNALNDSGQSRCRVTALHDPGQHQLPAAQVDKWRAETVAMGIAEVSSLDAMLDQVDGVLILCVDGHTHARLATPGLARGLPTYIDKPLTCSLVEAQQLLATSTQHNAPCYSASSLRFAAEIADLDRTRLGKLEVISAFGPGELNPAMEGLFYYGVHTIEMVDAIWGPGVLRVRATHTPDRDLLELEYADGRFAQLRMERKGHYDFGATVHGSNGVTSFEVNFSTVYDRLVAAMARFFEDGIPPVQLQHIVENVAVMQAGQPEHCATRRMGFSCFTCLNRSFKVDPLSILV